MILTNKYNIPTRIYQRIWDDLHFDPYNLGAEEGINFRTTELLGPPLIKYLWDKHRYSDELVLDASEFLSVTLGKEIHRMFEGEDNDLVKFECQVHREFVYKGESVNIFGTLDEIQYGIDSVLIIDNKTCLVSNLGYPKPEYEEQINTYRLLIQPLLGKVIKNCKLQLRYFVKDYTPSKKANAISRAVSPKAKEDAKSLPDCAIFIKDMPLYSLDLAERIVMKHIADHMETPDRPCTFEERWDKAAKVAVMLKGNKIARKLCNTEVDANAYIAGLTPAFQARAYLENRIPAPYEKNKHCQYYCKVRSVCEFAKSMGY